MTRLSEALDKRGIQIKEAAKAGIPYCSIWQQYRGMRPVGAQAAIRYERLLGIPREELRPDLWENTDADKLQDTSRKI